MGPIRGMKRRKKTEQKNVLPAAPQSPQPEPLDWWYEFQQRITGPLSGSESRNAVKFESVFKISRRTFNYICSLVKEHMETRNFSTKNGKRLCLQDQVAVALRRLSSGESLMNIGDSFGMNQTTVAQVTWRFAEAIEEKGLHHLCWPKEQGEMEEIKSKFERIRGLPNCCGAIDITHIMMTLPAADSSDVWLDGEKNCSMTLQAVVDPDMRFRNIVTGWPGSLSDDIILRSSGFFKLCEEGTCLNGKKMVLSEGTEVREYIVGDSGFPLLEWLMTPYQGRKLPDDKSEFNERLSATQMVARRAFVRLKEMWKLIQGAMWLPDKNKLPRIILACCILHNIVIDMDDIVQDEMPLSHHHDSGYHRQSCESADKTGSVLREKLSVYFSGQLP
ncbi:putative chromosomal replication initiator, DnaA, harbinger transposase-derived nuclease [Rosa chinensis]|uniref:Putative chromosomal replication initiator, DnaA, harbinger transposase-derived nuclease n=2 Tax=Rosa chinensis TaxID=74649 RepID=A0A2P6SK46_ROSCH|nr:protein ALP1-like isoform X2 [Rosa chinensis]XP_040364668.1 protein ALP1-like isoform X2 [Rosa chinensis]PRQ59046.1 putative chromosomal replication initiator, DnaA, harbinger transposase-derived nuclease [Rosa chinensis]